MTEMKKMLSERKFKVLTGNYGSGKTEIALNLAFQQAGIQRTTLVDLDIVNPYFRSGEKAEQLREKGIRVLMPTFALTTVDIPALPAEIQSVFEAEADSVIFDVGGDDTGAAALGRYFPSFMKNRENTSVLLVINCMRPLTRSKDDVLELAERIQARGRLALDGIVNNTNLGDQTLPEMVLEGEQVALACADRLGIPAITSGARHVLEQCMLHTAPLYIERYMKPEWMEA